MFLNVLNVITNTLWGGTVEGDERAGLGAEFREVVSEMTELMAKPSFGLLPGFGSVRFARRGEADGGVGSEV
ncbi:flavonoid 3-monooxygenase [Prunus yedoensis var. nudiflora]|uniref:Flavonoid 3-monooxygenase n=1 Tax=Prunus yedoensis var. nudiflora TaxID=2094558 RepID=A0A314ZKT5_PRUYE|nr:flavonoid 3-monooxygenase [Prunus yedoensis var. nudiflora]